MGGGGTEPAEPKGQKEPATRADEGPATWEVTLRGLPPNAVVYVDGVIHGERPLRLEEKEDPSTIRVEAEGFEDWEKSVSVVSSVTIPVAMPPSGLTIGVEEAGEEEETGVPSKKTKKVKKAVEPPDQGQPPDKEDKQGEGKTETKPPDKEKIDKSYPGL